MASHTRGVETVELEPAEIGFLRGGSWGAAQTALAMLVVAGSVVGAGKGQIERARPTPPSGQPLARALYSSLYGAMGAREVTNQPHVQTVLRDLHKRLVRQGYLRAWWARLLVPLCLVTVPPGIGARLMAHGVIPPTVTAVAIVVCVGVGACFLPRRTLSGARTLRRLRTRGGSPVTAESVGLHVALYGIRGSLTLLPAHATDLGLLDGGRWNRRLDIPVPRRSI